MKKLSTKMKKELVSGARCGTCGYNWARCKGRVTHSKKGNTVTHTCVVAP